LRVDNNKLLLRLRENNLFSMNSTQETMAANTPEASIPNIN